MNIYPCLRVDPTPKAIEVTVGREGPDPGPTKYQGYSIKIYIPNKFYNKNKDVELDVENEVLKITIYKEKGKWIRDISTELIIYWLV